MYEVSSEILEKIKNEFQDELDERNYQYSSDAIDKIIDEWAYVKHNLLNLLSKHPNWNSEKLMIQFNTDFSREIDTATTANFITWLKNRTEIEAIPVRDEDSNVLHSLYFELRYGVVNTTYLPEDYNVDRLNQLNEDFRFRAGMKVTKVVGKICKAYGWDQLEGFNAAYAKFCDALSPIKVTRHTCVSINPLDYLLMSNGNSWTSCHDIGNDPDDAGCHSSGTISYMLDSHSIIFYTVDAKYDGNNIELEPKIQRQVFGYNDYQLVQSRLYPQSNDSGSNDVYADIRGIMQKVIADCLDIPNLWVKKPVFHVHKGSGATCYADWSCQSSLCSTSVIKGKDVNTLGHITLGKEPICIECGYRHNYDNNISCCENKHYCTNCGCRIDGDDIYWIGDDPYCDDCCSWCEDCDSYVRSDDMVYVEREGRDVCDECIREYYVLCADCDEYCHRDDAYYIASQDKYVCPECLEENYVMCSDCGEYFEKDDIKTYMHKETGEILMYCSDCADNHQEDVEEAE